MQNPDPKVPPGYSEDNPELPPGYLDAFETYLEFGEDNVQDIWESLNHWIDYGKGSPLGVLKWEGLMQDRSVAEFQARILKAVRDRDVDFLKKLIKAIQAPEMPEPELNAIRAAIKAFAGLFSGKNLKFSQDWPTKQEVRRLATELLKEAGCMLPSERHWSRVFKKAGLSELLSVKYGPARKRVTGTKLRYT